MDFWIKMDVANLLKEYITLPQKLALDCITHEKKPK